MYGLGSFLVYISSGRMIDKLALVLGYNGRVKRVLYICLGLLTLILLAGGMSLFPYLRAGYQFFGFDHPKEYIVLLQNNMELRPTGGFLGSFARVRVSRGKASLLKVEDIYVPDGQLEGHVDPPWPIQAAFGQGWYKLRDGNFDPDFPTATKTLDWFFTHGKEKSADGFVAVNLNFLQALLKVTGPIKLVDDTEAVTVDNFYQKTQAAVEIGFFPGSTKKRDFLGSLGRAAMERLVQSPWSDKLRLVRELWSLAQHKQIYVVTNDAAVTALARQLNFAGELTDIRNTKSDYFSFFESNLGSNKANCCIKRQVKLSMEQQGEEVKHQAVIEFTNTNPATLKDPPFFWGGAYVNYLRIVLPLQASVSAVKVGDTILSVPLPAEAIASALKVASASGQSKQSSFLAAGEAATRYVSVERREEKGLQILGFFVLVDALESKAVSITYSIPRADLASGKLVIQKQGGVEPVPYTISKDRTTSTLDLETDVVF